MKPNKKAILGMVIAMVMSLGIMGSMNVKGYDIGIQQVSVGCAYVAGSTEGGTSGAWSQAGEITGAIAAGMAINGAYHAYATTTNPVGWGYWATTALVGL